MEMAVMLLKNQEANLLKALFISLTWHMQESGDVEWVLYPEESRSINVEAPLKAQPPSRQCEGTLKASSLSIAFPA